MTAGRGRILCVDDTPDILRSLQWLLQKQFDVQVAPSSQEGLALVRKSSFDVVISEQWMPGMVGSEFLREVRKISPRTIPILLTGRADMQAILRSVNEGEVFRFINKPWNISELPKVVAEAVAIARLDGGDSHEGREADPARLCRASETILLLDDDPAMLTIVEDTVGSNARIICASNLAEAIEAFGSGRIGVVLSETVVGGMDATRLLKILKSEHPEIVSVVVSSQSDSEAVVSLINQGQIYRFVPKPVKPGFLKLVVSSAVLKHQELRSNPAAAKRYSVEKTAAGTHEGLVRDVRELVRQVAPAANDSGLFLQRLSGGFKRLFGH